MSAASEILITVPATSALLRFSRMSAAAAAASLDFDVDELDDIRSAVGEAVGVLLSRYDGASTDPDTGADPGNFEIHIQLRPESIEIRGTRQHASLALWQETELTAALLGATVDEYSFDLRAGQRSFHLVKRRVS